MGRLRWSEDPPPPPVEPICWLCARPLGARTEWHHPKPKSRGGRETVPVHPICHRTLHATFSNLELDRLSEAGEAVAARPELAGFLRWIAGKPADFHAPTRRRTSDAMQAATLETEIFPGRSHRAFLFDMDGTLINSIASAERVWGAWAVSKGLDPAELLPRIHGKRAAETIAELGLEGIDIRAEAQTLLQGEIDDVAGIVAIEGVVAFLDALPPERWAIVTSAPLDLARRRLEAAGLSLPATIVSGLDVEHGKPAPDCFLLGAERLGVAPEDCLVFEDAPAGIAAAEAAGMDVMVVTATHAYADGSHAYPTIASYERLTARSDGDGGLMLYGR